MEVIIRCQHCGEAIWPNDTIYGPSIWFAYLKHSSGCEEYECPGQPHGLQTYGPHEPMKPPSASAPTDSPPAGSGR
ncbi:hypothetical protein B1L11_38535 [Microbispora sp. GKU 823]|nr:hypothetical protein B1L11_38535 [Microbispora sp. GKU 823]